MGLFLSRLSDMFNFGGQQRRVLLLGLDAAGKTTILYKMKLDENVTTIPTIGFNVEEINIPNCNVNFCVWDIGGQERLRPLWKHYFRASAGLIFVIDSADRERIPEAKDELHAVLNDSEMRGVPVVVLANKQDLGDACSTSELTSLLKLSDLKNTGHDWYVQPCVATVGQGLYEGFKEMAKLSHDFVKQSKNNANY
ncbi:hypothetical protein Ciccas_010861 [Cichlidogyrus casuarinus]|uniref:ADP-ribosylation factor n=1 Tax=Cichlidogyrus casuarinus TaxID=1844966 RepID=A0ABD2PVU1_9PLAT